MSPWKNAFGKPALWIVAGAFIICGTVVANNIRTTPLPVSNGPVLNLQPAGIPGSPAAAALHEVDQALSDVAASAAKGVVFIKTSDGAGASEGSGFVYRSDGWIITNDHVVGDNKEATVILHDGREVKGKITHANDPQLDIALVKIDASDLTPLVLADSDEAKPGQFAIAVGSPFGLNDSVTIGHISGLDRGGGVRDPRFGDRAYVGMLQTDAAINPGNSGGPLLNIDGQVVGINTTIFTQPGASMFGQTGGSIGIGFAISSNVVKAVADELIAKGSFQRGFLGANPVDIKPYKLKELGLSGGAVLQDLTSDGPAEKAGLRQDDVVTMIDGQTVNNNIDLRTELYRKAPGDTVNIQYRRGSETKSIDVKLAGVPPSEQPQQQGPQTGRPNGDFMNPFGDDGPNFFPPQREQGPGNHSGPPRIGVSVQALDDSMRKQFDIPNGGQGVVVVSVEPHSFASRIGLHPGDLIQSIDGKQVGTIDDIKSAMSGANWGDTVSLKYSRYTNGVSQTYSLSVPLN